MTRRRRRAVLALGALATAAAHCAALEPSGRRLITFDEAHNALSDTVTEVANEAVNTASNFVSTLLGGDSRDETTPSLSVTIGTSTDDSVAEKHTTTDDHSLSEETPTTTETPATPTIAETTAPRATRQSGIAHAVSKTKRPTVRVTRAPKQTDYSSDKTGNESASDTDATPTAAPPTTPPPTDAPVAVTEAPVTIVISTPAPVAALTEIPVTVLPTTAPAVQTETPVPTDTPLPTTQSSSVGTPETGVIKDVTDPPVSTGSTTDDVAVIIPDESTVVPIATTEIPAEETGSADTGAGVPTSPESPTTWIDSSASNRTNETVTVDSASGSEENSDGTSPGHVHASSSADVSVDGSDMLNVESSNSYQGGKQKKDKKKSESHSDSGDCSAGSSSVNAKGGSKSSTSNSRSTSDDGSSGMGALVNPGGVSDVNTSAATYYSLGTGSIVAIVGVIAGIMGVLVMFVAISRKNYSDDDGESPLPYGHNMDIRSVARLSPTFMQDDSFMESGYNGTALMVAVPPNHFDGASSTSGESADEVPSLRGNMMAANHCDPLGDISMRSRVPSIHSYSGDLEPGNVRVSALYSAGSSMTSSSAISGSWSSVLASDTERQTTRNTRDTSLSAWSAANLSSFGSTASGASGMYRNTRSSSALSGLSGDLRQTGGSDRIRSSSRLTNHSEVSRVAAGPVESHHSDKSTEI